MSLASYRVALTCCEGRTTAWSCTRWGLPRIHVAIIARVLLPHDFTLTPRTLCKRTWGGMFLLHSSLRASVERISTCVYPFPRRAVPRVSPGRRYLPP